MERCGNGRGVFCRGGKCQPMDKEWELGTNKGHGA